MNQKKSQLLKYCMQRPKSNINRLDLSFVSRDMDKDIKMFTLRQIYEEATKILQSQGQINLLNKQTSSEVKNVKDLILFIKNQNNINSCKINSYQQLQKPYKNQKHNLSSKHHDQIAELRKTLQNKNQTIVQLNMMHQEAKLLFDQQTKNKQKNIQQMVKQIYELRAQNEILKQKVEILMNYRSKKQFSKKQSLARKAVNESNHQLEKQHIYSSIIKKCSINTDFQTNRISSNHDIKDIIEVMSTNTKSISDQPNIKNTHKNNRFSYKNQSQHESKITETNYCRSFPATEKSISKKYSMESDLCMQQPQLIQELNQLRQNQSKLLDRIYERDEIILQLLKINRKNQNPQKGKN